MIKVRLPCVVKAAENKRSRHNSRWFCGYTQMDLGKWSDVSAWFIKADLKEKINPFGSKNSKTFSIKSTRSWVYIYKIFSAIFNLLFFLHCLLLGLGSFFIDWLDWLLLFLATYPRVSVSTVGTTLLTARRYNRQANLISLTYHQLEAGPASQEQS